MKLFTGVLADWIDSAKPALRDAINPTAAAQRERDNAAILAQGDLVVGSRFRYTGPRDSFNGCQPGDCCRLMVAVSAASTTLPVQFDHSEHPAFIQLKHLVSLS